MVTLVATFNVQEGHMEEVIAMLQEVVPQVREAEEGCLAYIPHTVKDAENTIIMYEKYEDRAALAIHMKNLPKYFENIMPLMDGEAEIKVCEEII
ncbi:MAG TPA: putative quinol monooxygenase [Candidatus Lokiarchaeia archaeon]|nr:putative quinol monooxygenase [Candidatus Lokiarchaeia archaeon]